jgi:hypothetical protein
VKNNWFETWILAPLLAPPAIIVDPFTFYCCALSDDGPNGSSTAEDDQTADLVESSEK